jgi:hypothetical protein
MTTRNQGAWLVLQAKASQYEDVLGQVYEYPQTIPNAKNIGVGDVLVVGLASRDASGDGLILGLGRVGTIERTANETYKARFDRYLPISPPAAFDDLGGDPRANKMNSINRVDGGLVTAVLLRSGFEVIDEAPRVGPPREPAAADGKSQLDVRDEIFDAVIRDLLGPAEGEDEEIAGTTVRERYLLGQLAPRGKLIQPEEFEQLAIAGDDTAEEGEPESDAPASQSLMPASLGMTFAVDGTTDAVRVTAGWGQYRRVKSETRVMDSGSARMVWKRIQCGGTRVLVLGRSSIVRIEPDDRFPDVIIEGIIRRSDEGDWVITVFLVNGQSEPESNEEEAWLYQPVLRVSAVDASAVFRRRPGLGLLGNEDSLDAEERRLLSMQYRKRVEFAVGHGVAVHAEVDPQDSESALSIATRVIPFHDVPDTEARDLPGVENLVRDMKTLSEFGGEVLATRLAVLADAYEAWIDAQEARIALGELAGHEETAKLAVGRCKRASSRLREGIEVIRTNPLAASAFRFANEAMWQQRIHSEYALRRRRGEVVDVQDLDRPEFRSWFPFQLAYILISIPSITEPTHPDRIRPTAALADLLWFPTGGGKTEAYLGVAAYTMGLRRLQGDLGALEGRYGVAVIMRYTLRLLTIQQFQRASTLMCAMEVIRRKALQGGDPKWGLEPLRIGLWVGARATPNSTSDSDAAIKEAHKDVWNRGGGGTPYQLTNCPWCGSKIEPGRDLVVDKDLERTITYCSDSLGRCPFSRKQANREGLPVVVVDEEIYKLLPSLLIGTVDKFAQMPWKGEVGTLFGRVTGRCLRHGFLNSESSDNGRHNKKGEFPAVEPAKVSRLRPPDLIIQDELHLISGPLGSMVGLYETAVDQLSDWALNGTTIRPKVIASTATIRRAKDQVHGVFLRDVEVFPPRGLDIEDNFFSRQHVISPEHPGRRYMGICAPGRSRPAVLIRVYVALLSAAQRAYLVNGQLADPWMTLVGYFNSPSRGRRSDSSSAGGARRGPTASRSCRTPTAKHRRAHVAPFFGPDSSHSRLARRDVRP